MLETALEKIAEKILALDEASLAGLWHKYKTRMENFDTTKEWEKAVIIFFIINSVRVKNQIFNQRIKEHQEGGKAPATKPASKKPSLKRIK